MALQEALFVLRGLDKTPQRTEIEDENAKLKHLLADAMLDNVVLKDLLGKP